MDLNEFESVRRLRKTAFKYCCGISLGVSIFLLFINIIFYDTFIWYLALLTTVYSALIFLFEDKFLIKGLIVNLMGLFYILFSNFPETAINVVENYNVLLLIPLSMVGLISGSFYMLVFGFIEATIIFVNLFIINLPDYHVVASNMLITGIAFLVIWFLVRSLENALRQSLHLQANLQDLVDERTAQLATSVQEAKSAQRIAEQANLRKSQFLATMSHELRTPLNAIINMTEFIDWFGPLNSQQKSYQDQVRGAGEHLLHLINDILDLSKIEAGRVELQFGQVDCGDIAQEVLETVRPLAESKGLQVSYHHADGTGLAWADSKAIKQIVLNLLSNAIKFTETGQIRVALEFSATTVNISVHDTGIGIALEQQQFIWESFRQIQSADDREYEGTGLGMSITKQLVDLHGGDITVESELGQGTQFQVCLPTKTAWEQRHKSYVKSTSDHTILVVDDNPNTVAEFGQQLDATTWSIVSCLDSREALAIYQQQHPAIVVLDATLAFVSAHSLIAAILAINPDQALLIVTPTNDYNVGLEAWPSITRPWPQALDAVLHQTLTLTQQQQQLASLP
ncbi:sensor histidine kinase RcsC [Herpetosiphon gulosus]|uniref:histidine kinase n=2 Tax=Herpetosiphon gulosus TaxID=1973496 RepID=A0ABP9WYW0_9CHLR